MFLFSMISHGPSTLFSSYIADVVSRNIVQRPPHRSLGSRPRQLTTELTSSSKFVAAVPPAQHAQAQTQMQTQAQGTAAATKLKQALTTAITAHADLASVATALHSAVATSVVTAQLHTTTTIAPATVATVTTATTTTSTTTTTRMAEVGTALSMTIPIELSLLSVSTALSGHLADTMAASLHETSCFPLVNVTFTTLGDCYQGNGIGGSSATIEFVIDAALGLSAMPTYPYYRRLSEKQLKRLLLSGEHAAGGEAAEGKFFENDMLFSAVG